LRELFGPALDAERIITSCGGGVAVSSDAFTLHLLGHRMVAVYDGGFAVRSRDRVSMLGRYACGRRVDRAGSSCAGLVWRGS